MQVAMVAPNMIQIGIQNQKLDIFDDSKQLQKDGGLKKIQAIRVFLAEKYIRGFEIFYKLNDGNLLKAGHCVPKSKKELQNAIMEIGPDDYVSEIFGSYQSAKKNRIINITFITYRGKVQTFGGKGEKSFGFVFPGSTFGAFKGGQKKSIEWLEIDVLPLPEDFKLEMEKLGILRIQRISEQPERTQSNLSNSSKNQNGQGSVIVVPKIQIAKPMIAVPAITVPQVTQQQNINLQQQQPQQNIPYQQQQQQSYQQYPQNLYQQQYPQQQYQQIPNQQNPYVPYNQQSQPQNQYYQQSNPQNLYNQQSQQQQNPYNQQTQSQNPYSSSYPKFN